LKKITIEYEESKKAELYLDFFINHLLQHIKYSNKQYGDVGEDVVTKWSVEKCMANVNRYLERFENNSRPGQERLDVIKSIDYLIRVFYKDIKVTKSKEQILLEKIYHEITKQESLFLLESETFSMLDNYISNT